jgi:hypothetical protein
MEVKTGHEGVRSYYTSKIDELDIVLSEKTQDLRRLEAQRNELNSKGTHTHPGESGGKRTNRPLSVNLTLLCVRL